MERRLAAILEADIVGFSRLMGADEAGTHTRVAALYEDFIEPLVGTHHGRVVKTMGDGYLCEFASVVDAVECAVAWQSGVVEREAAGSDQKRITFRIGINVGDIIVDAADVFGDGVNVAARLESIADPGSIFVSDDAYRQVRGKVSASFEDLGLRELKNIEDPVRVYRVRLDPADEAPTVESAAPLTVPDEPSIAVLPFTNLSGDPGQDYFSDGVTEDIITALSRIRWFFVIARSSSFAYRDAVEIQSVASDLGVRYVMTGSVRRSGDRIRVTAELLDGSNGRQLWARRYDSALQDIFDVQDDITQMIVGAIEPELSKAEQARARAAKPENLDAWDLYLRGMARLHHVDPEALIEARELFGRAIALDDALGPAYAGLAEADYHEVVYGYALSNEENRARAIESARRAVSLDPQDAGAHATLGRVYYLRREHAAAILELETALSINPSLALAHYGIGAALVFSGRAEEAPDHLHTAIRLSPQDPNMGSFLVRLADASYLGGDFEEAIRWAIKALQQPNFQWSRYAVLLASLARADRTDEVARWKEELLTHRPDFSIEFVRDTHLFSDSDDFEGYLDGLRLAGIPETSPPVSA